MHIKTSIKNLVTISACLLASGAAMAVPTPVNLNSWSALTLDFSGGQAPGNWDIAADNNSVTQTVNADPSFFLNNINQTSYEIDGTWQVLSGAGDDDYMGFVFGYQNSSNFYLFDWKRGTQSYQGTTATQGMSIKKLTGATGDALTDLSLAELWENGGDFGDMTLLAQNQGAGTGWAAGIDYDFNLDFNTTSGQFSIEVMQGSTTLWDVTVNDSTFTGGQFGFYNYSQRQVKYSSFTQTGGIPTPAPTALLLIALGLVGIGFTRKAKAA